MPWTSPSAVKHRPEGSGCPADVLPLGARVSRRAVFLQPRFPPNPALLSRAFPLAPVLLVGGRTACDRRELLLFLFKSHWVPELHRPSLAGRKISVLFFFLLRVLRKLLDYRCLFVRESELEQRWMCLTTIG